jgi:hypothetical protein
MTRGEISPVDIVEGYLEPIAHYDDKLHAFIEVYADDARMAAKAAADAMASGHRIGPLHGIPVAVKDIVEIEGRVTTGGCGAWRDRRLVAEASTQLLVFADRHPAHEAQAVEQWLAGRESDIERHRLPRYGPECNPDAFLHNDLKQELENEPLPESTSGWRDTMERILDRIARMSDRIRGDLRQSEIDFALN